MPNENNSTKNKEISPIKKVIDILDKNGYRILKAEEETDNPHAFKGIINLQIVPNNILSK